MQMPALDASFEERFLGLPRRVRCEKIRCPRRPVDPAGEGRRADPGRPVETRKTK
jgi:hypothetical protein